MTDWMIEASAVSKVFGDVVALDEVSLRVARGSIAGLLGHNGAGKTTLVNVFSTLLAPSGGSATVAGFDVVTQDHQVRQRIGLTGQFASVDEQLSGMDNLVLIARLLGATRSQARTRANELIEAFDLAGAANRPVQTYSGGMRRRLDLAASIVGQPEVIFLDEPTTGLDPVSRLAVWEIVESLVAAGATVLLTTQYLDEADRLANSITVLANGRVVASGTPAELKATVGRRAVHLTMANDVDGPLAVQALARTGLQPSYDEAEREVHASVQRSTDLAMVVRALDDVGVEAADLRLTDPSLNDVYLSLSRGTAVAAR